MTALRTEALDPAVYGLTTITAASVAARLANVGDRDRRRALIAAAGQARRADLALMRQLLIERDGRAPDLAALEAEDDVLIELAVLATA